MARDFGPTARGAEPAEDLLVALDGRPFGHAQRSRFVDYPEDLAALRAVVDVPDDAMSIDYLIGEPDLLGRGLGARMIRALVADTWTAQPGASCVIVAVAAGNTASWRALQSAGLSRVGEGFLEPDNPVDDGRHVVYRTDRRPGPGGSAWPAPASRSGTGRDIEATLSPEWSSRHT